jgi:hypothetical protein
MSIKNRVAKPEVLRFFNGAFRQLIPGFNSNLNCLGLSYLEKPLSITPANEEM